MQAKGDLRSLPLRRAFGFDEVAGRTERDWAGCSCVDSVTVLFHDYFVENGGEDAMSEFCVWVVIMVGESVEGIWNGDLHLQLHLDMIWNLWI